MVTLWYLIGIQRGLRNLFQRQEKIWRLLFNTLDGEEDE